MRLGRPQRGACGDAMLVVGAAVCRRCSCYGTRVLQVDLVRWWRRGFLYAGLIWYREVGTVNVGDVGRKKTKVGAERVSVWRHASDVPSRCE